MGEKGTLAKAYLLSTLTSFPGLPTTISKPLPFLKVIFP